MTTDSYKRKLTAILSADAVGYSRLMADDEVATVHRIKTYRDLIGIRVREHHGRVVDSPGDNLLAEFPSALDATRCAIEVQRVLKTKNTDLPADRKMEFRIGIHLGDVLVDDEMIYGDGVNIAARLESLAEAGGISISGAIYDQVKNKLQFRYKDQGVQSVKNIDEPVQVYRVIIESETNITAAVKHKKESNWKRNLSVALGLLILLLSAVGFIVWDTYFRIPDGESTPVKKKEFKLPETPCIAVLPFTNMSGDPEQEYFSDGITEEIITTLSRSPYLLVIARNSTFIYKGKPVKVQQVGQELGATHILEGSVRKEADKVRITAQLVSADTGNHIWAETYDCELKDILILQNEISEEIAGAVIIGYHEKERERVRSIATDNYTALDFLWRGVSYLYKVSIESNVKARDYFKRSIEIDPKFSSAYALVGQTELIDYTLGFSSAPEESLGRAFNMAQKCIALNESDPLGYFLLASVYSCMNQHEQALAAAKKGLSLYPNSPGGLSDMAFVLNNMGRPEEAIELMKKALRLDPHLPAIGVYGLGEAYYMLGQYKESIKSLEKALIRNPNFLPTYSLLSSNYINMWSTQQSQDPQILDKALKRTEQATKLGVSQVISHAIFSWIYLYKKQYEKALYHGEKAFSIYPNSPEIKSLMGVLLIYKGKSEEVVELLEKEDLNIRHNVAGSLLNILGISYRLTGRYDEALETQKHVLMSTPVYHISYSTRVELAILYCGLNQIEHAQIETAEVLKLVPNFSVEVWGQRNPFKDQAQIEIDMAALRKAGLK